MKPRILTNKIGSYIAADWDGENLSGIRMIGDEVLILPDVIPEKTKGGLFLADDTRASNQQAAQTGTLIALGPDAFTWNRSRTKPFLPENRPAVGNRVIFERYSGTTQHGLDGREYRIMSDFVVSGFFDPVDNVTEDQTNAA